jgi:hypothetical protein
MPGEQVLAEFYKTDLEASLLTKINYSWQVLICSELVRR